MFRDSSDTVSGRTYLAGIGAVEHETTIQDGKIRALKLHTPNRAEASVQLSPSGTLEKIEVSGLLGNKPVQILFGDNGEVHVVVDGERL